MSLQKTLLSIALCTAAAACSGDSDPGKAEDGNNTLTRPDAGDESQNSDNNSNNASDPDLGGTGAGGLCEAAEDLFIVDEILSELVADSSWSFAHSSQAGRAYALSLPGTDAGSIGEASAAFPCTEAVDFDPFCEPEPQIGLTKCLRIGCESATVAYAETYFTTGGDDPDAPHEIKYDIEDGAVEFATRPIRRWRNDLGALNKTVSAELAADFTITRSSARRFAYEGAVSTVEADGMTTATLTLTFEELGGLGPATIELVHDDESLDGTLTQGDGSVQIAETGVDWTTCDEL
jgi:hypothetical protein